MLKAPISIDPLKRRLGFERSANTYNKAAILQREIARRLIEQLDLMELKPERIIDLGAGTGFVTHAVKKKYPKAHVVALDISLNMLASNYLEAPRFKKPSPVCSLAEQLPFADQSADLVISSVMLQWCNDPSLVFQEALRVLKPEGALLFSTFGPDTLMELRQSWDSVDSQPHIHTFLDMDDLNNQVLSSGLKHPVFTREIMTMTYPNVLDALKELKHIGATNANKERRKGLTTKKTFTRLTEAYNAYRLPSGDYPFTYEVVYGHALVSEIDLSLKEDIAPTQSL